MAAALGPLTSYVLRNTFVFAEIAQKAMSYVQNRVSCAKIHKKISAKIAQFFCNKYSHVVENLNPNYNGRGIF